jgi:hypothetical protein
MCGIGPFHIRILCDNTFEGGLGFTPSQVGDMTLDQVFMLLCDRKALRKSTRRRVACVPSAIAPRSRDGQVRAVADDGSHILATAVGKSLAQRIMEAKKLEQSKKIATAQKRKR